MRQDQWDKLQGLEEKLADVFLFEAEPAKWPGHGLEPSAMDKDTRGDRYWCKKNAVATLSLIHRVIQLVGTVQGSVTDAPLSDKDDEGQLDKDIASAEKEAAKLMKQLVHVKS